MSVARWMAEYEDGDVVHRLPGSYERLDRSRPYTFSLLAPDGQIVRSWYVLPEFRLLYRTRNQQSFGNGAAPRMFVLVGIESRANDRAIDVWKLEEIDGALHVERRDDWGEGDWERPQVYDGE